MITAAKTPVQTPAQTGAAPAQDRFQSRPFAELPLQPEHAAPDIQTQLETAQQFGHNFGNISILPPAPPVIQRKAGDGAGAKVGQIEAQSNETGLPDKLKAGLESMSGLPLDDVNVHFNSPEPAQIGALAYTQGTDIHLGPGQEEHLPHEAWHVVQQLQGRVTPTMTWQDALINDSTPLEHEADVMGPQGLTPPAAPGEQVHPLQTAPSSPPHQPGAVIQARWMPTTQPYATHEWDADVNGRQWYLAEDRRLFFRNTPTSRDKQYYGYENRDYKSWWIDKGYGVDMNTVGSIVERLMANAPQQAEEAEDIDLKQDWWSSVVDELMANAPQQAEEAEDIDLEPDWDEDEEKKNEEENPLAVDDDPEAVVTSWVNWVKNYVLDHPMNEYVIQKLPAPGNVGDLYKRIVRHKYTSKEWRLWGQYKMGVCTALARSLFRLFIAGGTSEKNYRLESSAETDQQYASVEADVAKMHQQAGKLNSQATEDEVKTDENDWFAPEAGVFVPNLTIKDKTQQIKDIMDKLENGGRGKSIMFFGMRNKPKRDEETEDHGVIVIRGGDTYFLLEAAIGGYSLSNKLREKYGTVGVPLSRQQIEAILANENHLGHYNENLRYAIMHGGLGSPVPQIKLATEFWAREVQSDETERELANMQNNTDLDKNLLGQQGVDKILEDRRENLDKWAEQVLGVTRVNTQVEKGNKWDEYWEADEKKDEFDKKKDEPTNEYWSIYTPEIEAKFKSDEKARKDAVKPKTPKLTREQLMAKMSQRSKQRSKKSEKKKNNTR